MVTFFIPEITIEHTSYLNMIVTINLLLSNCLIDLSLFLIATWKEILRKVLLLYFQLFSLFFISRFCSSSLKHLGCCLLRFALLCPKVPYLKLSVPAPAHYVCAHTHRRMDGHIKNALQAIGVDTSHDPLTPGRGLQRCSRVLILLPLPARAVLRAASVPCPPAVIFRYLGGAIP